MGLGNTFGSTTKTYGSGKNIWHGKSKVYPVGGTVSLTGLVEGDIIPAGSMAWLNELTHEAKIVQVASFDSSKESYAIGDLCVHGGVVYVCKTAIAAAAAWDASKWVTADAVPAYSSSSTYSKDDIVEHDGLLYKAKAAIGTAEAWTAAHWDELSDDNAVLGNLAKVNGLTECDLYVDGNAVGSNGAATVSVVYQGMLFVSRLEYEIPSAVLSRLPMITTYKEA